MTVPLCRDTEIQLSMLAGGTLPWTTEFLQSPQFQMTDQVLVACGVNKNVVFTLCK